MTRDPIGEAHRQWVAHGWADAADGMAMVTSVVRAQQLLMERIDAVLRPRDLTFARYEVLRLLSFAREQAMAMSRLGSLLQVHPTSVTSAVDRLVAQGYVERVRGDFSSNCLEYDNGAAAPIGSGGHTVFTGDRVGNTQPDVMAPGVDIASSCDQTGSVIGPCPDHGQATASGTSMAAPHVAGAAAVLKQANPRLRPAQIQSALKATVKMWCPR